MLSYLGNEFDDSNYAEVNSGNKGAGVSRCSFKQPTHRSPGSRSNIDDTIEEVIRFSTPSKNCQDNCAISDSKILSAKKPLQFQLDSSVLDKDTEVSI